MTTEESAASEANVQVSSGNGHHDAPSPETGREAHEAPAQESRPAAAEPAAREFHAQPRESGVPHAPIAHFEPSPRPEAGNPPNKPYVVWSSTPSQKDSGDRGPEE